MPRKEAEWISKEFAERFTIPVNIIGNEEGEERAINLAEQEEGKEKEKEKEKTAKASKKGGNSRCRLGAT